MPLQPVDFVPECGAYKQRIEKELRSMKARQNGGAGYQPPVGPYAVPDKLPPELLQHLQRVCTAETSSSRGSVRSVSTTRSQQDPAVSAKLRDLEQQIVEERESRKQVEAQLDRLQGLLEKLAESKEKASK